MIEAQIIIPPSPFLTDELVFPQLGPLYIKRFCEERSQGNIRVDIIRINSKKKIDPFLPTGFSCTTPQYAFAKKAHMMFYDKTIVGGPHCAHYDVSKDKWNFIIKGDGCFPFYDILNGNQPIEQYDPVDQLPYRDESLHDYKYYLDGNPTTVMMTARGCPNNCYFCEDAKKAVRLKSIGIVKKELKECVDLGFSGIMFFDDLFCINLSRVKKLCDIIKPFKIKFRCFAHARNFSREMAQLLKGAGVIEIGFGAEHADQRILDLINKKTTVKQNYDLVKTAHEFGIRVKAFTMLGLPGENKVSVEALRKFITTSGIDDYDVTVYYPYRGTYIADHPNQFDLQVEKNGSGFYKGRGGISEYTVRTSALTSQQIQIIQRELLLYKKR